MQKGGEEAGEKKFGVHSMSNPTGVCLHHMD
jgi:hypothetical protein